MTTSRTSTRTSTSTTKSSRPSAGDGNATVVLGVDPGTLVTGYAVLSRRADTVRLLELGTIENRASDSMPLRLRAIYNGLRALIDRHHPDEFAIESAFYGKNAQSALKLGHARGVSILAAVDREIPTAEYSPRAVKKAVVGTGNASKEQVRFMVASLLRLDPQRIVLDASDAAAIALCHLQRLTAPSKAHKDWRSYVEAHPERVSR